MHANSKYKSTRNYTESHVLGVSSSVLYFSSFNFPFGRKVTMSSLEAAKSASIRKDVNTPS